MLCFGLGILAISLHSAEKTLYGNTRNYVQRIALASICRRETDGGGAAARWKRELVTELTAFKLESDANRL